MCGGFPRFHSRLAANVPADTVTREFDRKITVLTIGLAPKLLAPTGIAARTRIQSALRNYYLARHDEVPDASAFVRNRAAVKRQMGVKAADLASGEMDIAWASLTNTIPSLAWVFVHIFSRPDYAERVRQEALEATSRHDGIATVDVTQLSGKPFLSACVQEVQRLYNKLCGYRRVLEDTVLRDADGQDYLLKQGCIAQWFHGVPHLNKEVWGKDAREFRPERFIDAPAEEEKKRRGAMIPFGGGKHLCPGRRFALTEITCMVASIAMVFEVDGVTVPAARAGYAGCAVAHLGWEPDSGPSVQFRRRDGWEDVQLEFQV
jgi:cytochrome P450